MNNIEIAVVIIFGATFFASGLCSYYFYNRILKIEYSKYHYQWLEDGSPPGVFWYPKGSKFWSGGITGQVQWFKWTLKNPKWTINDQTALQYLHKFRISQAIGWVTWLIMVTFFFVEAHT